VHAVIFVVFAFIQIFEKHVVLDSLAFYWRPKANLFSNQVTILGTSIWFEKGFRQIYIPC
jgi:hypothetical protein